MGRLEDRIRHLEACCGFRGGSEQNPREQIVTDARLIRMLEDHIDRWSAAIQRQECGEPVSVQEWKDIDEEGRQLDQLCEESDARHKRNEERWQEYIRQHRLDLVNRGASTFLDKEIAAIEAGIAEEVREGE